MIKILAFLLSSLIIVTGCSVQDANTGDVNQFIFAMKRSVNDSPQVDYLDAEIYIENNTIYISLIPVTSLFEYSLYVQGDKILISKEEMQLELYIGSNILNNGNLNIVLEGSPRLIDDTIYVPMVDVCESMDLSVYTIVEEDTETYSIWIADFVPLDIEDVYLSNYEAYEERETVGYRLKEGYITQRGIAIGSTAERVMELYGEPHEVIKEASGHLFVYYYLLEPNTGARHITFAFNTEGVVIDIFLINDI